MGKELTLVIEEAAPGLNEMLRWHWSKRYKETARWSRWVWLARCQASPNPPAMLTRALVSIERRSRGQLDPDNLHGSCKLILDALRDQQLIEDDSPEHIDLVVTQSRGRPRTTIKLARPL